MFVLISVFLKNLLFLLSLFCLELLEFSYISHCCSCQHQSNFKYIFSHPNVLRKQITSEALVCVCFSFGSSTELCEAFPSTFPAERGLKPGKSGDGWQRASHLSPAPLVSPRGSADAWQCWGAVPRRPQPGAGQGARPGRSELRIAPGRVPLVQVSNTGQDCWSCFLRSFSLSCCIRAREMNLRFLPGASARAGECPGASLAAVLWESSAQGSWGSAWVIYWSAAWIKCLSCKAIVMNRFSVFLLALLRHSGQSCCLLWIFCCKTLKMLHSWLFAHTLRLRKFPDLGRVKKKVRQIHPCDI